MANHVPPSAAERLRHRADRFIHHWVTEVVLLALILLSVGMLTVELTVGDSDIAVALETLGELITAIFAVELGIRFWVARKKSRFFARYWIDIIAILPLTRPLRIFRVVRLLRLYRAGVLLNRRGHAFSGSAQTSRAELTGLALGSVILVIFAALVLFHNENKVNTDFGDFQQALWFSAYSLIGGEPIGGMPATSIGRWATLLLMLGGMTLFGMFVGTISAGMITRLSATMEVKDMDLDELVDHVIVCGWNRSGPTALKELFGKGTPLGRAVVIVTEVEGMPPDIPKSGVKPELIYHHHGDYTLVGVLEAVNVAEASIVILLRDELIQRSDQDRDARTVLAALTVERMVPGIYTVAELHSDQNEEMLRLAGVEQIVIGDWYAGVILGAVAQNEGLVSVLNEILTSDGNRFQTIDVPATAVGKTVAELHQDLFVRRRAILISLQRNSDGAQYCDVNPEPGRLVRAGERMVILSDS